MTIRRNRSYKKWLAVIMIMGVLSGNYLTVFATDYYVNTTGGTIIMLSEGVLLRAGDRIVWNNPFDRTRVYINNNLISGESYNNYLSYTISKDCVVERKAYQTTNGDTGETEYYITLVEVSGSAISVDDTHVHNYQWITTIEPTEESDGLSEYRCHCGAKDGSQPIPKATAWIGGIVDEIRAAAEGETILVETDMWFCYTGKIMKELAKRADVSLKTVYTDKDGAVRSFTIPAGQAPTDGELFYGFTYLGNLYGWNE